MATIDLKAEIQLRIDALTAPTPASEILRNAVATVGLDLDLTNIINVLNSATALIDSGTPEKDITALNAASIALGVTSKPSVSGADINVSSIYNCEEPLSPDGKWLRWGSILTDVENYPDAYVRRFKTTTTNTTDRISLQNLGNSSYFKGFCTDPVTKDTYMFERGTGENVNSYYFYKYDAAGVRTQLNTTANSFVDYIRGCTFDSFNNQLVAADANYDVIRTFSAVNGTLLITRSLSDTPSNLRAAFSHTIDGSRYYFLLNISTFSFYNSAGTRIYFIALTSIGFSGNVESAFYDGKYIYVKSTDNKVYVFSFNADTGHIGSVIDSFSITSTANYISFDGENMTIAVFTSGADSYVYTAEAYDYVGADVYDSNYQGTYTKVLK